MKVRKLQFFAILVLSAVVSLSIGPRIDQSVAADAAIINIAYSSNILGYMEPCG